MSMWLVVVKGETAGQLMGGENRNGKAQKLTGTASLQLSGSHPLSPKKKEALLAKSTSGQGSFDANGRTSLRPVLVRLISSESTPPRLEANISSNKVGNLHPHFMSLHADGQLTVHISSVTWPTSYCHV
jgi:hypothetical protein